MQTSVEYIKRRYLSQFYSSKYKSNRAKDLKNNSTFPELCNLVDGISPSLNFISKLLYGNPLPQSYNELGKSEYIPFADDIIQEINWTVLGIRNYKTEIRLFLEYKKIYENFFLVGKYELAEKYLLKIEQEICYSLWTLENRFLLLEFAKTPEDHKSYLSEFNKNNKGFFTQSLAYYLSNKSEKNFSVPKYNLDVNNFLKFEGELAEANRQFYYSKINFYEYTNFSRFKEILAFDFHHSIIDRYLTLVNVLKVLKVNSSENSEELDDFINSRINYLIKKFDDEELIKLFLISNPHKVSELNDVSFSIKILDLYTSGFYNEAIEELKFFLEKNPSQFEYYIIYVKSILLSGNKLQYPSKGKSFQNNILNELYYLYSKSQDPYTTTINLSRISKQLSSFKIYNGIFSLLNHEDFNKNYWKNFNILSLSFLNPLFASITNQENFAKTYFYKLKEKFPSSITLDFFLSKINGEFEDKFLKLKIPDQRKKVEFAKLYQSKADFEKSVIIWEDLLKMSKNLIPVYDITVKNLFYNYVELKQFDKAINLYVNSFFENQYIVQKIDCSKIHKEIRDLKFKNIQVTIDLPIFYTISNADENEVHTTYEKFNLFHQVTKASELKNKNINLDHNKLIFYLQFTCNPEIFKHSIYIDGSKDGYSERISILNYLLQIDKDNDDIYRNQLNSLTEKLIIQEGLQQLDESKIYVNEQGLINTELKEYEGLYNRYKTISNIFNHSNSNLIFIDVHSGKLKAVNKNENEQQSDDDDQYSTHPLRDVFKDCFDVITEKFLYSKFGIAAYLSTRIRHGVLLGEIRPIFEKFHLISQKDNTTNQYCEIGFWNNKYKILGRDNLEKLNRIISKFSEDIDNLIFNLIKKNLQIKTENENSEGWFDYVFDEAELILYSIKLVNAKDYSSFIKLVLDILWNKTDSNLELIRGKIQSDVKNSFIKVLNKFSSDLQSEFNSQEIPDIYTNITTCSTEVQIALDRIAGWFNRSGSQTSDFKLDKLIAIVLENVNNSYPLKKLNLKKEVNTSTTFKGEYYSHFADLFRIFLDNALKHSLPNVNIIPAEIIIEEDKKCLNIKITNSFPDIEKIDLPTDTYNNINAIKLATEGKSGVYKANKIIRLDLKNDHNNFRIGTTDDGKQIYAELKINYENLII